MSVAVQRSGVGGGCDSIDLLIVYDYAISHLRSTLLIIIPWLIDNYNLLVC